MCVTPLSGGEAHVCMTRCGEGPHRGNKHRVLPPEIPSAKGVAAQHLVVAA